MNTRMCRGYLGVFGPKIDEIANEYTQSLIDQNGDTNPQLKRGEYHITVASKHELQALRSNGTLALGESNPIPKLDQLNSALEKTNTSPVIYGLGTNRKGVYWVTVVWALGQRFRAQLGLPPKQFHITLTSVDEHEIDKGPSSVIWVHPSLAIVETILGLDNIDSTSSSQTEFLASFIHGLLAQYEFTLAQSAAELLVMSEPTNPRGFVCLGDVSVQRDHWKLAMLCFGSALSLYVCDPTKTDLKTDRISSYCLKQLRRSAEFTDWGTIFMITGLLNDETASGEFDELPANSMLRSYLCQPWPAPLKQYLQRIYEESDSSQLPKRTSNSRTRVLTLVPHKPKSTVISMNNAKDIPSPHVNDIVNVVASLDIGEHALSTTPDLGLFPRSPAKGPISTYVGYRLPRFFGWIIPFYMALMSTPRNVDDIAALASPNIGIRHILTLTEETPLPDTWFRQVAVARVRHTYVPIPNYKPPTIEQMDIILRRIHEPGGSPVLIHCGGGKGRAGTVAACYLAAFGFGPIPMNATSDATPAMSANAAIAAIRLIRSGSIETAHQEGFVETWVSALWKRNKLLLPRTLEPHPTPLLIEGSVNLGTDLLVLCGLPGSGKSWFSQEIVRRGGFLGKDSGGSRSPGRLWRIISQDESRSRATCETDISRAGQTGSRAVLDRCNPTSEERRLWIKLASWAQHPIVVWFDYKPQLCIDRAQDRESHPTLTPGPRVLTAVTSMNRSFQPPSEWKLEGFQGFAHITSFEAAIDLCKIVCPAEILKFPRTAHILDLGAATSDDVMEKSSSSTPIPIRAGELVVITEKIDGANLGFSLSPLRELRVQNRSHYVNSHDHPQFRKLDSWISSHRQDLYTILDRDDAFPERYILYGEWMAATHSISYSKLGDLFYAFDLFDRATNTFASRRALEATLINTNIQLTPIICTDKAIPANDTLAKMVQQESRFYPGPMEGIYLKVETELAVRQRGKVVRADFITGNEHWGKEEMRWNTVLRLS
ncbi:ATP dependent DNA ligase [Rhizoctonia solani]|uniref:ATP dependent DNA ligase n=1 Tax=Rhizoctonia solani TaxID=456999 RepID=A0A8H7LNE9_9AGAM|nr:ATP dependent DNA ligase [Rhizoctonia solani]KAF8679916.1 DNA-3'-diphospho-5'-guanosine diphosphatase [Rhizoctonia solani]QRW19758.1 ATP dependent DNA ligase [Rhizoctonia solani]